MHAFNHVIREREQLRAIVPEPRELVTRKTLHCLDRHCEVFIRHSPFVLLSTADRNGNADVSPRGDPPGFVSIIDASTLVIPDRPGNRRADSMENILQNPKVGMIFLVPGKTETLRISGTASIVGDPGLLASLSIRGRSPKLAIVVEVKEAFFHCSKCMIRSGLWQPESWADVSTLPSLAETMVDAGRLALSKSEMQQIVEQDEKERLY